MIPKEFDYVAPATLAEALAALQDNEDAKVLAGGHSLIPTMKLRLAEPSLLVDLRKIEELRGVRSQNGHIEIGAMVTHYRLHTEAQLLEGCPLLTECAFSIGDAQVRARGTLGGSLAHADPAADLTAAILALDGVLVVAGSGDNGTSTREISASEFFVDLLTTALERGEIVTAVRVPRQSGRTGAAYVKVRNKASHYALVGAAAVVGLDDDGKCNSIAVAITGAASKPFRLEGLENALRGSKLEDDAVRSAIGSVGDTDVEWMSDLFGSEEYRKHLAGVVAGRAIRTASGRASG
ncbi:MAG TPA: xanthine dehydrogenase family protein subunit M [Chloroflexia bacterium]|nr:xanthine dehydrogenase family protein subunit M [Chloroflexia bacterium]